MTDHLKGLLITTGGVLALTPDALLIKLADLPASAFLFWRGLLTGVVLLSVLALVWRARFRANVLAIGRPGLAIALCYAVSTACFVSANTVTVAANVLVIVSMAPILAAVFSTVLLREPTPRRTWIAAIVSLGGVALVAGEQLALEAGFGELLALGCAIFVSLGFVIIRGARAVNMLPATALGSLLLALLASFFFDVPSSATGWGAVVLCGAVVVPAAYFGLTIGPRYLAAPEVGLLLLLETVLGPLWVWLVIGETPSPLGIVGGAIIISTLIVNTTLGLRLNARKMAGAA